MGVVYVLIHSAMPGLVKIGTTEQAVEDRIRSLSRATGVPGKFQCAGAWTFTNARAVEKALHDAFADHRGEKEFFELEPERVIAILKQFGRKNVTPGAKKRKVKASFHTQGKRRSIFTFKSINIAPGATLVSRWDPAVTCRVVDDRKVEFEGETMSLTAAARKVNERRGKNWPSVGGPGQWMYGNPPKRLSVLRIATEK